MLIIDINFITIFGSREGLHISQSAVDRHANRELAYSLKTVRTIPGARNMPRNKTIRRDFIEWIQNGVDYLRSCMLVGETEFRKKHVRKQSYSKKGVPCTVEISEDPSIKSASSAQCHWTVSCLCPSTPNILMC